MGFTMYIREATPGDCQAVYELNLNGLGYDYPIEKTKARLELVLKSQAAKIFVAEYEGKVIGYVHAADYECTYSDPVKNILAMVVDENHRKIGAGRALMMRAEQWAEDCGCSGVRLVSGFNRQGAHKFYAACGYTHRKDQKNFIKLWK